MYKKIIVIATACVVTACAVIPGTESTVKDVQSTTPDVFSSNLAPREAMACIERNIDEGIGGWTPVVRSVDDSAGELQARSAVGTAALFYVSRSAEGSEIKAQISRHYAFGGRLVLHAVGGCANGVCETVSST